jgi:hypothetical protein
MVRPLPRPARPGEAEPASDPWTLGAFALLLVVGLALRLRVLNAAPAGAVGAGSDLRRRRRPSG